MTSELLIKTPIIPVEQRFYGIKDQLDHEAIAFFLASGFFPSDSTFYKGQKVMKPASTYKVNGSGDVEQISTDFSWNYQPVDRSLTEVTNRFAALLEDLVVQNSEGKNLVLPLSGGLDSRSLATALMQKRKKANTYSYQFERSFNENRFGKEIAKKAGFPFKGMTIPAGSLWDYRSELGKINGCYSEFTHARQMAVREQIASLGDMILLGHWGDVLFDGSGVNAQLSEDELIRYTRKKILKEGGLELAERYWLHWGLKGTFDQYLNQTIESMYSPIRIDHSGARIRAFKSMYWAPRWTSVNISVFSSVAEVHLPYYDDTMCRFICEIPEELLDGRQIQIEYIKTRTPELAEIAWQGHLPCNLYNYKEFNSLKFIPARAMRKVKEKIRVSPLVKRNWEIQFLGWNNMSKMNDVLQGNMDDELLPEHIVKDIFKRFYAINPKKFSHPLSMLLTLATFRELNIDHAS